MSDGYEQKSDGGGAASTKVGVAKGIGVGFGKQGLVPPLPAPVSGARDGDHVGEPIGVAREAT